MEIILLERVTRLGNMGDVVNVKNGYARNYLLPQGKALRANKANMVRFEGQRADLEARNEVRKKEANGLAGTLDGKSFVAIRQASDTGQLFGSVTTRDISGLLADAEIEVSRNLVRLEMPIKVLGIHTVAVDLHPEVETKITVNVARSEEEAERQARGEDVFAIDGDDEDKGEPIVDVDEVFEDEDVAREAATELAEDAEMGSDADAVEPVAEAAAETTAETVIEADFASQDASEEEKKD